MNYPQTIVIGVEVNHIIICSVQILRVVDVFNGFADGKSFRLQIISNDLRTICAEVVKVRVVNDVGVALKVPTLIN
jgi:hypothetical protein